MSINAIQFQKGLNLREFLKTYGTEQQCRDALFQMRWRKGFRKTVLARYARTSLHPDSTVWADGLACFQAIDEAGFTHMPLVTGGGRTSAKHATLKWVNTMLGSVKNAITDTYNSVSTKHVPRYLAEFGYRFNRRYDLPAMIERLVLSRCARRPCVIAFLRCLRVMDNQEAF